MGKYILKRIALAFVTIWAVATITFFLMNLVPGGPFLSEKAISPAATKALEAKYGLDKPMAERYFTYISDAAHGDFGDSLKQRGRTVMDIIATKFPVSARLGGMAVVLALCVGVPLGVLAAYKRGTFIDSLFSVIATCGIAVPGFVICTLLLYVFGVKLQWLPTLGLKSAQSYIMPVVALTEKIFTIPGLGGEFIKAINGRDYTMIMGTTIFLATIMIVMNVIVDIVYKLVDPRIKLK